VRRIRRCPIKSLKRFLIAFAFFAALICVWHFLVVAKVWSKVLVPDPLSVWRYLVGSAREGDLWSALWVTSKRLLIGYFIGVGAGIPLGLITARFQAAHDTIGVLSLGLQTLPSVCWVPLALLWFGQTETAMLFVVIMGTVWSVIISTDNGVRAVPPIFARAAKTMGSKGLHTWLRVILPAALPFIVSGVKQGWAFAWRSLMAAEIYVTILTGSGLGMLLHYGRENLDMSQVIGVMFVIVLIGLLADKILFSPWESFLHRRWGLTKA
jgi:NitT/TauT family transport system permease protein